MKIVFLTNIPAPYRESVHDIVSDKLDGQYHVIYCSPIEGNRQWKFKLGSYARTFLTSKLLQYKGRTIYLGSNIRTVLNTINPDTVIIGGFSLPMIVAYFWAILKNKKIISFSDANIDSEKKLTVIHRVIRKIFYSKSHAYIGASQKTLKLFKSYGAVTSELYQSHLCANNSMFEGVSKSFEEREFDVILCGQMIEGKMFDFSLDVIEQIHKTQPDIKVKLLGAGPLQAHLINRLKQMQISYEYPGFVEQVQLPQHYATAKLFFFPSLKDAWGVVANESCAAGTPVFTCPIVGAADELILNEKNGYVLEPAVNIWAEKANKILENPELWKDLSKNALKSVESYTYNNAALGIVGAIKFVKERKI